MRFNLISNINNGLGLQRDFELLSMALASRGHVVQGVQFNLLSSVPKADVNIFLETVVPQMLQCAPQNWVIPNPEWWEPSYHECLPRLSRVLCKTQDSVRLFTPLAGDRVRFLGFTSKNLYRPAIMRLKSFLHVAGNSIVKNTAEILCAWMSLPYSLTLVTRLPRLIRLAEKVKHVTVRFNISDEELTRLMNEAQFHLCPSQYEGFGHYLHEGLSVGALVITGDGPPMNEFGTPEELLVPTTVQTQRRLADMRKVDPNDLIQKAHYAMSLPSETVQEWSAQARQLFEVQEAAFQQRLTEVLKTL